MDEGRIVAWHKRVGDAVAAGDVLFEVETDKATMEVESPAAGTLRRILFPADATAPVATVIALITSTADEPLPTDGSLVGASGAEVPKPSQRAGAPRPGGRPPSERRPSEPEPLASGSSKESDRVRSSPAARKRAEELGVDISKIVGSGPGGRVTLEDVDGASAPSVPPSGERREPLTRMRRAVAEAMTRSAREAPQFSISRDVDMTAAGARRKAAGVSYTDVIVAAAAAALRSHPRLRSRFDGDAIVTNEHVDIGIAVALDAGLIVPVVRGADRKSLGELRREREELEAAVRAGHARADAFGGAVITVSNLGTLGVDRFTAIVNPPEAAILAVGRVSDRVVAVNGAAAVRPSCSLTLTVDHRVADGADAARFLADVVSELERA